MSLSKQASRFKSRDLIIAPCSDSKKGSKKLNRETAVSSLLPRSAGKLLKKARKLAFSRRNTSLAGDSPPATSLWLYTGYLNEFPGLRKTVRKLLAARVHVLTLSGGYGFIHPYEYGQARRSLTSV